MIPSQCQTSSLSLPELARKINEQHERYEAARGNLNIAIEAGLHLIAAKAEFRHGEWSSWVSDNLKVSLRTVQLYMRLARNRVRLEREARLGGFTVLPIRDAVKLLSNNGRRSSEGVEPLGLPAVGWRMTGTCGRSLIIAERDPDGIHAFVAVVRDRSMYQTQRGTAADHIGPVLQLLLQEAGEREPLAGVAWKFSRCDSVTSDREPAP